MGGTRVLLRGAALPQRSAELRLLACRFNLTAVGAALGNASSLVCAAPPLAAGYVAVELTDVT